MPANCCLDQLLIDLNDSIGVQLPFLLGGFDIIKETQSILKSGVFSVVSHRVSVRPKKFINCVLCVVLRVCTLVLATDFSPSYEERLKIHVLFIIHIQIFYFAQFD